MNGADNLADGPHYRAARCFCLGTVADQEHQRSSRVGRTSESVDVVDRSPQTCPRAVRRADGVPEPSRRRKEVCIRGKPALQAPASLIRPFLFPALGPGFPDLLEVHDITDRSANRGAG
jgi:hypothetical protein